MIQLINIHSSLYQTIAKQFQLHYIFWQFVQFQKSFTKYPAWYGRKICFRHKKWTVINSRGHSTTRQQAQRWKTSTDSTMVGNIARMILSSTSFLNLLAGNALSCLLKIWQYLFWTCVWTTLWAACSRFIGVNGKIQGSTNWNLDLCIEIWGVCEGLHN